ncbi:hypothetical protein [Mycobacterium simiae]|nr:hypothetical protein [Mycobacterium simiae]
MILDGLPHPGPRIDPCHLALLADDAAYHPDQHEALECLIQSRSHIAA